MQVITIAAAALLAAAPVVQAASAIIHNKCNFPVYLWSVDADNNPQKPTVLASGGSYSEKYKVPSQGGVSLKLANTTNIGGPITQFEYTLAGNIWYDLSNVNCKTKECPFEPYGMYMNSGKSCPTVSCAANIGACAGVYNQPYDDWASLACDAASDIVAYLCVDSPDGSAPAASAPASSAPAASVSAVASSGSTVVAATPTTLVTTTATTPLATTYGAATTSGAAAATPATTTAASSNNNNNNRYSWGGHRYTARAVHHRHARV